MAHQTAANLIDRWQDAAIALISVAESLAAAEHEHHMGPGYLFQPDRGRLQVLEGDGAYLYDANLEEDVVQKLDGLKRASDLIASDSGESDSTIDLDLLYLGDVCAASAVLQALEQPWTIQSDRGLAASEQILFTEEKDLVSFVAMNLSVPAAGSTPSLDYIDQTLIAPRNLGPGLPRELIREFEELEYAAGIEVLDLFSSALVTIQGASIGRALRLIQAGKLVKALRPLKQHVGRAAWAAYKFIVDRIEGKAKNDLEQVGALKDSIPILIEHVFVGEPASTPHTEPLNPYADMVGFLFGEFLGRPDAERQWLGALEEVDANSAAKALGGVHHATDRQLDRIRYVKTFNKVLNWSSGLTLAAVAAAMPLLDLIFYVVVLAMIVWLAVQVHLGMAVLGDLAPTSR